MSEEQLKTYWAMHTDAWSLFKEFSAPDNSEEFWKCFSKRVKQLDEKHDSKLFRDLVVSVANELERII